MIARVAELGEKKKRKEPGKKQKNRDPWDLLYDAKKGSNVVTLESQ